MSGQMGWRLGDVGQPQWLPGVVVATERSRLLGLRRGQRRGSVRRGRRACRRRWTGRIEEVVAEASRFDHARAKRDDDDQDYEGKQRTLQA